MERFENLSAPQEVSDSSQEKQVEKFVDQVVKEQLVGGYEWDQENIGRLALSCREDEKYRRALLGHLKFEDQTKDSETLEVLALIDVMHNELGEEFYDSWYESKAVPPNTFVELLKPLVAKGGESYRGSYYLNLYCRQLFDKVSENVRTVAYMPEGEHDTSLDSTPEVIADRRYGILRKDGWYISDPVDFDKLGPLVSELNRLLEARNKPQGEYDKEFRDKKPTFFNSHYEDFFHDARDHSVDDEIDRVGEEIDKYVSHKITKSDLVLSKGVEVEDYDRLMGRHFRRVVTEDFGLELTKLTPREQFYFLRFVKVIKTADVGQVQDFTKKFGLDGFKAFMAGDYGPDFNELVIKLGEDLPADQAQEVFRRFAEIVEATDQVGDFLVSEFGADRAQNKEAVSKIVGGLLEKGRELLVRFSQSQEVETFTKDLDDYNTELLLLKSSFKILKEKGEINLAELKNFSFDKLSPAELATDPEAIKQMRLIYERNYSKHPAEFREVLLKSFDEATVDPTSNFYILKRGKDVVAFDRFADLGDGRKYFGAFNVSPALSQAKIGEAMMESTLDLEAQEHIIEADCSPEAPISQKYLEKGFVVTNFFEHQGMPGFKIVRDDHLKDSWLAKNKTNGELEQLAGHKQVGGLEVVRISDLGELANWRHQFEASKVISRYFQSGDYWYLVFEPQVVGLQEEAA